MESILKDLQTRFDILAHHEQRPDLGEVSVAPGNVVTVLEWLKRHGGYVHMTHFTVVDWLEEGQFQLSYILTDPVKCHGLIVSTRIDREEARMETIHRLWPEAVTYEQEINEMYGISFPGSPRQGVEFILEDWRDLPPMRRDFDTVAYCMDHYDFRPGRHSIDPKDVRARFKAEQEKLKQQQEGAAAAPEDGQ